MYSQAPNEIPNGYSGSAFRAENREEDSENRFSLPCEEKTAGGRLASIFGRFRIGRYLRSLDVEDLLILGLVLLLLLEDGDGDLFPFLLLFLLFE